MDPVGHAVAMASGNQQDWHTLFGRRRELTAARDKALQELQITSEYVREGRRTEGDLGAAIERAERACDAVATFDAAHPRLVGEDEEYENAQAQGFMARFA